MLPVKDEFNIVVVGGWNPSIFNPVWIQENLTDNENTLVSLAFPLDDPTAPRKISFEGLNLFPGRKQLIISPEKLGIDGIKLCANKLAKIFDLLIHTPVTNCGINFCFEESNNLEKVFEALKLNEKNNINDKFKLQSSSINRKFKDQDGLEMNLSITDSLQGGTLGFNFHYNSKSLTEVKELITEIKVEKLYNQAILFCKDVYDLEIEEGEESEG